VVVIDTCSVFPLPNQKPLLYAEERNLYRVQRSEEILKELRKNLTKRT